MRQPVTVVSRLLRKAARKREEQKAWDMWLSVYPHMVVPAPMADKPAIKFLPFSKFYREQIMPSKKEMLTDEQIIDKFEKVKAIHQQSKSRMKQ